jgi:hypothetical protein
VEVTTTPASAGPVIDGVRTVAYRTTLTGQQVRQEMQEGLSQLPATLRSEMTARSNRVTSSSTTQYLGPDWLPRRACCREPAGERG